MTVDDVLRKHSMLGDDEHKRPTRMQPLNSESILTKEQLFDMFQQILGVKKFEHQILFNALMVRLLTCFSEPQFKLSVSHF